MFKVFNVYGCNEFNFNDFSCINPSFLGNKDTVDFEEIIEKSPYRYLLIEPL